MDDDYFSNLDRELRATEYRLPLRVAVPLTFFMALALWALIIIFVW